MVKRTLTTLLAVSFAFVASISFADSVMAQTDINEEQSMAENVLQVSMLMSQLSGETENLHFSAVALALSESVVALALGKTNHYDSSESSSTIGPGCGPDGIGPCTDNW